MPTKGAHKGRPYMIQAASRGFFSFDANALRFDRIPLHYVYWWRQFNRFLLRCAFRPDARRTMGEDR